MTAGVHFDHQPMLMAIEVRSIWADGMLASELGISNLTVPQEVPEALFGACAASPEGTASSG
jgi:hypothetical protein